VITLASLVQRVERLGQLSTGFALDQTRFIRQRQPLSRREREAYMAALEKADLALCEAKAVLEAALKRIEAEHKAAQKMKEAQQKQLETPPPPASVDHPVDPLGN
jgi:hypothetical protein